ncbi:blue light receptor [Xylographa trunciseda]|nr:blue light receptor [Xylographa trunciseda]
MDQTNVDNMNGYYGNQYSADDLQRLAQVNNQHAMMGMMRSGGMVEPGYTGVQTLDEIITQNNKEIQLRRNSQQYHYGMPRLSQENDPRRSSMLEFGPGMGNDLDGFQFDPSPVQTSPTSHPNGLGIAQRRMESRRAQRRASIESLGLNTQFQDLGSSFGPLTQSPVYHQAINPGESMSMDMASTYVSQNLSMGMDYVSGLDQGTTGDVSSMNLFSPGNFSSTMATSPIHQHLSNSYRGPSQDPGGGRLTSGAEQDMMDKMPNMHMSDVVQSLHPNATQSSSMPMTVETTPSGKDPQDFNQPSDSSATNSRNTLALKNFNSFATGEALPSTNVPTNVPQYRNAYSSSGFDMLGVLMRVAARPKPQINIGAVDMSCAFVVCDISQHDLPIVYCSDIFERLTGYTKHEILGRNCRFLQAPDGKVASGVKRKYVDDQAVLHLKNMIDQRQEAQISLINYRKGGQPFMNLLTMIPITYDSEEMKYYVGFQVDLVEQPTSITNKNPDGSYAINYQRGLLPRYVFNTPENINHKDSELGQTIGRDEVSTVLSTIGTGESELSKRIWDKVLLENTDDVVHVLSLKGLFLYLSPSSRKILEYEPHELVGTALSSVCHPSDIVPVTRELKDTSTGAAVNVVFRVRRKHSGYTWFESHGSLHTEQGKGKKCIILVGRERPVYALARSDIDSAGGIGENELWTKMSTSGMFLFVSSNVKSLLDRLPEELVGTSAQSLMRAESRLEFGRMLELARTGIRATFKHDVQNKRGQTLHAQTTIYPGDAVEGQKPTFLVAQTRLVKMSRTSLTPNRQTPVQQSKPDAGSVGSETPSTNASGRSQGSKVTTTPQTSPSNAYNGGVVTQPGGSGLAIGNQDEALASMDNVFDELKTTRSTSWQFELRQMEKRNRLLAEELQSLLSNKKKRKRRKGAGQMQKDCANCHTRSTPEWRRGPSGNRDLCNSCGLRWAKQNGRISPRTSSQHSDKHSASPSHSSPISANGSTAIMQSTKRSPQGQNADSHLAKTARMEASAGRGYGGGIPDKIEEKEEPNEDMLLT